MTTSGEKCAVEQTFVRCACGKERPVRTAGYMTLPEVVRLAEMSMCRACEMDLNIAMDSCPESIAIEGGTSACCGTWHHEGPCQPYTNTPVIGRPT